MTEMGSMFKNSLIGNDQNTLNLTNWDVSNVTSFMYMFAWTGFVKGSIDFSNWVLNSDANLGGFKWKATFHGGMSYQPSHPLYWSDMPGDPGVGGIQEKKIVEITAVEDDYITVSDLSLIHI